MIKNCDNCQNQNNKKMIQDCQTFGYPLFNDCQNWKPRSEKVAKESELGEKVENLSNN